MTDDTLDPTVPLGCYPSPEDDRDYLLAAVEPAAAPALPVTLPALPPGYPWDQNDLGICVGMAVVQAAVIAIHKATGKWVITNAAHGFRAARDLYHQANPWDPTYKQGAIIRDGLEAARKVGILGSDGKRHRITRYNRLTGDMLTAVEVAIANGQAPIFGFHWPLDWCRKNYPFDTLPDPPAHPRIVGGHAIIGWRVAEKHPAANDGSLRVDPSLLNSWDGRFTPDGTAYFNGALVNIAKGLLFEAWVITA